MSRWQWQLKLIQAVESGVISQQDISLAQRRSLLDSKNNQVAAESIQVFGRPMDDSRDAVVSRYREDVYVGDRTKGQVVFRQNCEVCHALDSQKRLVGPDLRTLTSRSIDGLLEAILDPSQKIDPKFTNYTFVLQDGRSVTGIVTDEGAGSVNVVDAEGLQQALLRSSIDTMHRLESSIMPEGFELKIDPPQMSDLIAYLQSL